MAETEARDEILGILSQMEILLDQLRARFDVEELSDDERPDAD